MGEYKDMALKMLSLERVRQGIVADDASNPTHYQNRLTADIGHCIGLNADDIRRAELDWHASKRFPCLGDADRLRAAARCREFFDVDALVKALAAEVNSLSEESEAASLPRKFVDWACASLNDKYTIFANVECTR